MTFDGLMGRGIPLLGRFLPVPSSEALKQALYPGHPFAQTSHIPVNAGDVSLQVPQEGQDGQANGQRCDDIGFHGQTSFSFSMPSSCRIWSFKPIV